MNEQEAGGRVMAHAFNDELEKISVAGVIGGGVGRAFSHLGGAIGRGLSGVAKPGAKGFRKAVGDLGTAALKNKKQVGIAATGLGAAGLIGAGGMARGNR
tara:strand:- start:28 stop:327 length:300 start_codon:yes stop_codon:yes gene_type:complete